ncbi:MAG: hypothetical protein U0744_15025 [Gemmataceae bacterium]
MRLLLDSFSKSFIADANQKLLYAVQIAANFRIPDSQHLPTQIFQCIGAKGVLRMRLEVWLAIKLNE